MRLHEDETLFRQAVLATAAQLHIPEIFIEKDYWVTYALHSIFHAPIGEETVFKGGTALSKCFGLIERFSEDIDLVVKHHGGETDNQLKRKIRNVGRAVTPMLAEVEIAGLTRKMGMNRKTAHSYPKIFAGRFGQVRNVIVVEATWFGYYEPYRAYPLSSYIHDMMLAQDQQLMIEDFGLLPFEVNVQQPTRTLCEKIMSLVRFSSYSAHPMADLRMKIRHVYDLHKMLEEQELSRFFNSSEFDTLICKVGQDDMQSFRNNNEWLIHHPAEALLFRDVETCWEDLKATYTGDFSDLVYGVLPGEQQILATLIGIKDRLLKVEWHIDVKLEG
jgi:hypothetical protein